MTKRKSPLEKKAKKPAREFSIWLNEGSFFDEPWLTKLSTGEQYRYDRVPTKVKKAFAVNLRARGTMTPQDAAMIIGWIEALK